MLNIKGMDMSDKKTELVHEVIKAYDELTHLRIKAEEYRKAADETSRKLSILHGQIPRGFYQVGGRVVSIRANTQYPEVDTLERLT